MIIPYFLLTKPRVTFLATATTFVGFYMATVSGLDLWLLAWTLLGSLFLGGGANSLNQFLERDADRLMERTKERPLVSGVLTPKKALIFGGSLVGSGIAILWLFCGWLAGVLGIFIALSYVFIYTPLKQKTILNTFVGALPGAAPILIGWSAASDSTLNVKAWVLFAILFVWQFPHFFAIAWRYRDDYRRGHFKIVTIHDRQGQRTAWQIVLWCLVLFPVSLLPTVVGLTDHFYFLLGSLVNCFFLGYALYLTWSQMRQIRGFIYASIAYLILILFLMIWDKTR